MNIYAATEKGAHKAENEDRIVIGRSVLAQGVLRTRLEHGMLAVADGVGGNAGGAAASHFLASELSRMNEVSAEALRALNRRLLDAAAGQPALAAMAATLSGVCIRGGAAKLFHIGNTRVWSIRGGQYLKQLTSDDTTVAYLVASGQLTQTEAERSERRNEITACFGGGYEQLFCIKVEEIHFTPPILITSDGVHDHLTVDEMEAVIEEAGLSELACERLIEAARKRGSADDCSVLLGCM